MSRDLGTSNEAAAEARQAEEQAWRDRSGPVTVRKKETKSE